MNFSPLSSLLLSGHMERVNPFSFFSNIMAAEMASDPTTITTTSSLEKTAKNSSKIVWTGVMVEILIDSYQEHECLWNMSSAEYKDKQKRSLAYEAVDDVMDPFEVKRSEYTSKWVNLRTISCRIIGVVYA